MNLKLIFLSALFCTCFISAKQEKGETINWDEKRPLTWNDYKGKPQKRFAAASTSYDILKSVSKNSAGQGTVKIQSVFFCNESWKKEQWVSDEILMHEQKHFDIVEIFARKLRKLIKEQTYSSPDQLRHKTDSLYAIIDKQLDEYQDLYDDKTDGSMNGDKQREWNDKVQKELKALDAYNQPLITITFN